MVSSRSPRQPLPRAATSRSRRCSTSRIDGMDGEQNALEPKKVEGQILPPLSARDGRWKFIRDVAVFELELTLNSFHSCFQVQLTLDVGLADLIFKHG